MRFAEDEVSCRPLHGVRLDAQRTEALEYVEFVISETKRAKMKLRISRDNYIHNTGEPAIRTSIQEYVEEDRCWTISDIGLHPTLEDADLWLASVVSKPTIKLAIGKTIEIEV